MAYLMIFPIGGSTRISTRLMTRAGRPARRVAGPGRVAKNFAMQFPTCKYGLPLFRAADSISCLIGVGAPSDYKPPNGGFIYLQK